MEHSVGMLATGATLAAIRTLSARLRALSDDDSRELPTHADLTAATQNLLVLMSVYGPIHAKTSLLTEDGPYEWHYIDQLALSSYSLPAIQAICSSAGDQPSRKGCPANPLL